VAVGHRECCRAREHDGAFQLPGGRRIVAEHRVRDPNALFDSINQSWGRRGPNSTDVSSCGWQAEPGNSPSTEHLCAGLIAD